MNDGGNSLSWVRFGGDSGHSDVLQIMFYRDEPLLLLVYRTPLCRLSSFDNFVSYTFLTSLPPL